MANAHCKRAGEVNQSMFDRMFSGSTDKVKPSFISKEGDPQKQESTPPPSLPKEEDEESKPRLLARPPREVIYSTRDDELHVQNLFLTSKINMFSFAVTCLLSIFGKLFCIFEEFTIIKDSDDEEEDDGAYDDF